MKPVAWMTEIPNKVFTTNPIGDDSVPLYLSAQTHDNVAEQQMLNFFECSACGGSDFNLFDDGDIQCSNVRCGCVMGGITVVEDDKP